MLDGAIENFPLFPLGIVALPTEGVPLHIFEDRFKRMVAECIQESSEFGILWLSKDELKPVGCACTIERVLERDEDGNLDLLARGTRPFRVIERGRGDHPYPVGVVEPLADQEEEPDVEIARVARELYGTLVEQATDKRLSESELVELNAYAMAGTVEFELDGKQQLLELRSENGRMRLLTVLLRAAIRRLELIDRAEARARSNGKVRFG